MTMPVSDSEEIPPAAGELASEVDPTPLKAMPLSTPELEGASELEGLQFDVNGNLNQSSSAPAGWVLIALVPFEGREPPRQVS